MIFFWWGRWVEGKEIHNKNSTPPLGSEKNFNLPPWPKNIQTPNFTAPPHSPILNDRFLN